MKRINLKSTLALIVICDIMFLSSDRQTLAKNDQRCKRLAYVVSVLRRNSARFNVDATGRGPEPQGTQVSSKQKQQRTSSLQIVVRVAGLRKSVTAYRQINYKKEKKRNKEYDSVCSIEVLFIASSKGIKIVLIEKSQQRIDNKG